MAVRVRLTPIEKDIKVLIPDLSPEGKSKFLANFAREKINEAAQHNKAVTGFTHPYDTFVDGRRTDDLNSVKPNGVIVAEWEFLADVVEWIADLLVLYSPVGHSEDRRPGHPGLYQRSHILLIDGQEHDLDQPIPPFSRAVLVNTTPYSRKIEGIAGRPPLSQQAPAGVYEVIANMANDRFKNLASIRFGFTAVNSNSALEAWAQRTSLTGKGRGPRSRSRDDWLRRQPSITIAPRA